MLQNQLNGVGHGNRVCCQVRSQALKALSQLSLLKEWVRKGEAGETLAVGGGGQEECSEIKSALRAKKCFQLDKGGDCTTLCL